MHGPIVLKAVPMHKVSNSSRFISFITCKLFARLATGRPGQAAIFVTHLISKQITQQLPIRFGAVNFQNNVASLPSDS